MQARFIAWSATSCEIERLLPSKQRDGLTPWWTIERSNWTTVSTSTVSFKNRNTLQQFFKGIKPTAEHRAGAPQQNGFNAKDLTHRGSRMTIAAAINDFTLLKPVEIDDESLNERDDWSNPSPEQPASWVYLLSNQSRDAKSAGTSFKQIIPSQNWGLGRNNRYGYANLIWFLLLLLSISLAHTKALIPYAIKSVESPCDQQPYAKKTTRSCSDFTARPFTATGRRLEER